MASAAEYILAFQSQAVSDSSEAVDLLIDFLNGYGMTDTAIEVLCQLIHEEGLTENFVQHLRESGFVSEPDVDLPEEEDEDIDELE
jgi:hypothetical protein